MTKYIFIDNFRGFANTYVPIVDVNFLVGENSTGKTSILGLLKLLSGHRFVWGQEFADEEVNFGHFKDMVSAHAEDRTYFRIGSIQEFPSKNKNRPGSTVMAMLFTYREREGLPRISRVTATLGSHQVSLRYAGKHISYKAKELPSDISVHQMVASLMPQWVNEHAGDDTGYRKVIIPKSYHSEPFPLYMPLFAALENAFPKRNRKDARDGALFRLGPPLVWIAPIRTKPRRTYDELQLEFSSEGTHTPYLIRRILRSKADAKKFHKFIQRVGSASGLFESIQIRRFGPGVTAPFEVDAVLDGKALNLSTVGYGVSQSLPVFVELLARPRESWFAIQQPEVHLHPRAQAALGDVFFEMASSEKKCFLIETHSDFTIDRFRMNYRSRRSQPAPHSQVLFFERRHKRNTVASLEISSRGELPVDQPDGYRRFFVKEELRVLGL